jgi:hypothetical protein
MRECIVSFGRGHNFQRGLERLGNNISQTVHVPFIAFTEYPNGCPTHQESPFAFKFYCISECVNRGYTSILWLDSSVVVKNNLSTVFQTIENQKYFFILNSHSCGEYCHDKALKTLNISREDSFKLPSMQGTNFGLNIDSEVCQKFLSIMLGYSNDGVTFTGPHNNQTQKASKDVRVRGHRHEQTAMSIVALRLGMNKWYINEHDWFYHDRAFVKNVDSTVEEVDMSE